MTAAPPTLEPGDVPGHWMARGRWTVLALGDVAGHLADLPAPGGHERVVDGRAVEALDSVGALLLARWATQPERAGPPRSTRDTTPGPTQDRNGDMPAASAEPPVVRWDGWTAPQRALLARLGEDGPHELPAPPAPDGALTRLGRSTVDFVQEAAALLAFLGEIAVTLAREIRRPARFRWRATLHHVGVAGVEALPIVGLLGVLMGIVVAYQGAGQLTRYGANLFVVDLLGLSMLREFAPLVTAIIVAGRSGSAFAAQLGTMSVTEEIDALRALGLSPIAVLVLPRLLALVVVMPLLTAFADALGLAGGMVMASLRLDVGFEAFLDRLPRAVSAMTLMLGVGKAPVFAAIVAVVGCFQGLRTVGGADSVGRQTTRSVVQSIFLVIVADAVFSVAFSVLGL